MTTTTAPPTPTPLDEVRANLLARGYPPNRLTLCSTWPAA